MTPRVSLRAEAIGCWRLFTVTGRGLAPPPDVAPDLIRLDTGAARDPWARGVRAVVRLGGTGHPLLRDGEGFSLSDDWAADSASHRIRLHFTNGLYGSTWVLDFPTRRERADTMLGQSQGFGDVVPPPPYPVWSVMAARTNCVAAADSASGV